MIRIENVSKYFDEKAAVEAMSLEIPTGSLFGLIGPNGAGKTTTLKMLATLVKPDRGRILIDGADITRDVREVRTRAGYMPDAPGAFRGLTCEEYLLFFGRAYGLHSRRLARRVEDVIELTDLSGLREDLTTALSTGMRQRLLLAKTLLHDPALLLLDEPASGLDPRARIEIRSLLKILSRMGKTIVISSHILADLEEICTDVGIIEEGRLVWHGPLTEATAAGEGTRSVVAVLRVPDGEAAGVGTRLKELDWVVSVAERGDRIEIEIPADRGNDLLSAAIATGVEILSFAREMKDLEAIFLRRTRGIVS